jgi:valyl-tRNA synthetase
LTGGRDDSFEALADEDPDRFVCVLSAQDHEVIEYLEDATFEQDPDVLDTWFSSGVWPISTMGWPEEASELLNVYNPSSVLCTAREIITLWVSRMVMFNRFFRDSELPFKDVFIHALVMDGEGQKMSKSLGNGVDPLDIIHSHGADALRLTICHMTTQTQDVRMPLDLVCPHCEHVFEPKTVITKAKHKVAAPTQDCPSCGKSMVSLYGAFSGEATPTPEEPQARNTSSRFDDGKKFCNKLWNAGRATFPMLEAGEAAPHVEPAELPLVDRWMLSRLSRVIQAITDDIKGYHYSRYAQNLYDILWRDFCDWYLEAIKPTAKGPSEEGSRQRAVLRATFEAILRLLHPVVPFVSETIYEQLDGSLIPEIDGLVLQRSPNDLLISAPWPQADGSLIDETAEGRFEALRSLVEEIRQIRAKQSVPPKRLITLHAPKEAAEAIAAGGTLVETLATLDMVTTDAPAGPAVAFTHEKIDYQLSNLADAVDMDAERDRLQKDHAKLTKSINALRGRLNNKSYIEKAPAELVEQTRSQLKKAESDLEIVVRQLEGL